MRRRARILVCYDFSTAARAALRESERIALAAKAELVILHVFPARFLPGELDWMGSGRQRQREENLLVEGLEAAATDVRSLGGSARVRFGSGDAVPEILQAEREEEPDLIVIGADERRGIGGLVLGDVAAAVCRDALAPTLVVRATVPASPTARLPMRRVIVGVDFSAEADQAVESAIRLASFAGGLIELVHVVPRRMTPEGFTAVRGRLDQVARQLARRGIPTTSLTLMGDPARVLLAETESDPSAVVVVGTRRRSRNARRFFGSVAEAVLRGTPGSVLVAHAPERKERRQPTWSVPETRRGGQP